MYTNPLVRECQDVATATTAPTRAKAAEEPGDAVAALILAIYGDCPLGEMLAMLGERAGHLAREHPAGAVVPASAAYAYAYACSCGRAWGREMDLQEHLGAEAGRELYYHGVLAKPSYDLFGRWAHELVAWPAGLTCRQFVALVNARARHTLPEDALAEAAELVADGWTGTIPELLAVLRGEAVAA